jgi:hypothetical protein
MRKAFGSAPSDGIFASFRSPWLRALNTHGDTAHIESRELAQFYFPAGFLFARSLRCSFARRQLGLDWAQTLRSNLIDIQR